MEGDGNEQNRRGTCENPGIIVILPFNVGFENFSQAKPHSAGTCVLDFTGCLDYDGQLLLTSLIFVIIFIIFGNLIYKGVYRLNCIPALWKVIYIEYPSIRR